MMCDLPSSQSKHGLSHFYMAKFVLLGVAATVFRCFQIKEKLLKGLQSKFWMLRGESKLGLCWAEPTEARNWMGWCNTRVTCLPQL